MEHEQLANSVKIDAAVQLPLLRIPPFPGSRPRTFAQPAGIARTAPSGATIDALIDKIRAHKVGGTYWGSQPTLPDKAYTLVRIRDRHERASRLASVDADETVLCWLESATQARAVGTGAMATVHGTCDPWHLLGGASAVIVDADDELALLAAISSIPVECVGEGRFTGLVSGNRHEIQRAFREHGPAAFDYFSPYTGEPISVDEAIEQCAFWRNLIDSNRAIDGAVGFAFWKRPTIAPLLWRGSDGVRFLGSAAGVGEGDRIAIWKSRTSAAVLSQLVSRKAELIEVEDGFIRSAGLGADCVPPLSITVDPAGVHFDPTRANQLEHLLETGTFGPAALDRARRLRELIVESGLTKYAAGQERLNRSAWQRRHILVPGQVEDDRAVTSGGLGLTSNLDLLLRVREQAPEAYLIYKPHPDVEAGHRAGAVSNELCLSLADEIVRDKPISTLIDLVDEVHVNTSLAGFEALLRGKPVTTYGVPFYAGWGLTRDLGKVPHRRSARRTVDELVAAVLLLYPRYLDPETGLPCPAEILVRRLAQSTAGSHDGLIVRLRRLQGRCRRGFNAFRTALVAG